jgi:hypothetical protein
MCAPGITHWERTATATKVELGEFASLRGGSSMMPRMKNVLSAALLVLSVAISASWA